MAYWRQLPTNRLSGSVKMACSRSSSSLDSSYVHGCSSITIERTWPAGGAAMGACWKRNGVVPVEVEVGGGDGSRGLLGRRDGCQAALVAGRRASSADP